MARCVRSLTAAALLALWLCAAGIALPPVALGEAAPQATPPPIQLIDLQVVSAYPEYLDFSITVASAESKISSAAIYRRIGLEGAFEPAIVSVFERAQQTTITSRMIVEGFVFPPFTPITYYWRVRDFYNNELTTVPITITFDDYSRNWQQIDDGLLIVHWYDYDLAFGQNLSRIAGDAYKRLLEFFGVRPHFKPRVIVLNSQADYNEFQSYRREQPNIGGQYIPGYGLTLQLVEPHYPESWLHVVVPHELSHLVSDLRYPPGTGLPVFLEEGLATYNEVVNRASHLAQVQEAARANALIPITDLDRAVRSPDPDTINFAYQQSATLFEFIVTRWGAGSLPTFLAVFAEPGVSFEDALIAAFGITLPAFEREWQMWLGVDLPTLTPAATRDYAPTATPPSPSCAAIERITTPVRDM